MSTPLNTVKVQLHQADVHKLLDKSNEYPDIFTVTINRETITLIHHIDGVETTLEITLSSNGTWQATKHIEV